MSKIVIKVDNLSKLYYLGELHHRNNSFRDKIVHSLKRFMPSVTNQETTDEIDSGNGFRQSVQNNDYIWALRDVSFEIKKGEVLGIIGRNGAGKSTLLKILSRITKPTKGNARINGRIASLLEVGTGFHPELTGRENIYLNGAILGMKKWEIKKRFDEIVAFAEIEKFLNTPVKRYSSGMYVRLAFAVAAHLDPEILLVDEVLAVGDVLFQKKCLAKMGNVAQEGRTVLFVSHNMSAVQRLCSHTIILDNGKMKMEGVASEVVEKYLSSGVTSIQAGFNLEKMGEMDFRNNGIRFSKCWMLNSRNKKTALFKYGEPFTVCLEIEAGIGFRNLAFHLGVDSSMGVRIFTSDSEEFGGLFDIPHAGKYVVRAIYHSLILMPGKYLISKLMLRHGRFELNTLLDVAAFEISSQSFKIKVPPFVKSGLIAGISKWEIS